jgi:hypothetical protein
MVQRDQEMRRILVEEETQLKNLVSEYKVRFERERERLLEALRECGRCTTLMSEILPTCVANQQMVSDMLTGKSSNATSAKNDANPQKSASDVFVYRGDNNAALNAPVQRPENDGFNHPIDANWVSGSTVQLKVRGPGGHESLEVGGRGSASAPEESLL